TMSKKNRAHKNSRPSKESAPLRAEHQTTSNLAEDELENQADLFRWRRVYALLPALLAILASINTLWCGFAADDSYQVLRNAFIKNLSNIPRAFTSSVWAFVSGEIIFTVDSYYRPLFSVLFSINYALFGTSAWGWHLMNVLIHAAVAFLVFTVVNELCENRWLAFVTAALFAVHPAHVESVAWISGVTDPVMSIFLLLGFYFYLRYRKNGRKLSLAAVAGFYFLALLNKETSLALPVIIAYCEVFHFNESLSFKKRIRQAIPILLLLALPTAIYFLLRYNAINAVLFGSDPRLPLDLSLMTTPLAAVKYLALMLIPAGYSYQHYTSLVESLSSLSLIAPLLLLIALTLAVFLSKSRLLKFAALWFIVCLAPSLAAIRQFDLEYIVQERYLYLPSIGFCLALALGIEWLAKKTGRRGIAIAVTATLAIVVVWGAVAFKQNLVWKDNLTVYKNCVAQDPSSPQARAALSRAYLDAGRPREAEDEAQETLRLDPAYPYAYLNLSFLAHTSGNIDKSIEYLEQGISRVSENWKTRHSLATIHLNLGLLYAQKKNFEKAEANLIQSNLTLPRPVSWYYTGQFYFDQGRYEEARAMLEQTQRKIPRWFAPIHLQLGLIYERLNQPSQARTAYERYLEVAPSDAKEREEVQRRLMRL
ncbi:MAG: tetratricopeptide repeat protein, partial [Acidobacteriota bacterium]